MVATSASSPAATKPRGIALHLGLNAVSAAAYAGWDGPLAACEFDANDMAAIARAPGHEGHRAADEEGDARPHARGAAQRRQAP